MGRARQLRKLLDEGHPVTGVYDADAALAAGQANALNINAPGGVDGMLNYLAKNRSRTNDTGDTVRTALIGRLQTVAQTAPGGNPFGRSTGSNQTVSQEMVHAAQAFLALLHSPSVETFDFVDTELDDAYVALGPPGGGGCGVWKDPDIAALKGLSQNTTSHAIANGLGIVEAEDVTEARAL